MARELRQIILDKEELLFAVEAHRRMEQGFLPEGAIADYKITGKDGILVSMIDPAAGKTQDVLLGPAELLQPVIRFCIENNIRLPREGRKAVAISNDRVTLYITLDTETCILGDLHPLQSAMSVGAN